MKEQGDGQNDEKRGENRPQSQGKRTGEALQLIADEDGKIHGENARNGLRHGQQVDEVFLTEPFLLVDYFFLDEGHHGITSANGEQPYLEESTECIEVKVHNYVCFM